MIHNHHMGHVARKPNCVACEEQRRRPDCAPAQSEQRLCYSPSIISIIVYLNLQHDILVSLRSGIAIDWFESYEDRFSRAEAFLLSQTYPKMDIAPWHIVLHRLL